MSPTLISSLVIAGLALVAILIVGLVFTRVYHRSTRERSLVRTGSGGRKIVMDGGIIVIPGLHELTKINMRTTRLEVTRTGGSALITLDRMRVDVGVEFYVTVQSNEEGIARAAQTLGNRTDDVNILRDMIEGKLVDGLRSVAAKMNLDDLHENRSDFVQQVQQAVSEDLTKNGLELEAVSLTALDQTQMEGMDENNVFNATGLQNQAERIATSRKRRAEIEAETEVAVAQYKQDGEIQKYEIEQTQEEARVKQSIEMESLRTKEVADKAVKTEQAERLSEEARIDREGGVRAASIKNERELEIAEQDRQIAVQEKSRDESRARAEADVARAEAVAAEESVKTARELAEAERNKKITILKAEQQAEEQATGTRVSARAEKDAAADRAEAMLLLAEASAKDITIRAEADKTAKLAEAEGARELIAAENTLSAEIIDFRLAQQKITAMPTIIAEMVKPAEKIGNISIHKVDGMGGGYANTSTGSNGGNGGSVVNQAFDEIRNMAVQMPLLKKIGADVGMSMEKSMSDMISDVLDGNATITPVAPVDTAEVEPAPVIDGSESSDAVAKAKIGRMTNGSSAPTS